MTMEEQGKLGQWLKERCRQEHLSLRKAGARTGLSHSTIQGIINGGRAAPETIRKLAQGFGGDGKQRLALEDHLLVLADYRTQRDDGDELTESMAQLMDKVKEFSESQIKMMLRFADFLIEIEAGKD